MPRRTAEILVIAVVSLFLIGCSEEGKRADPVAGDAARVTAGETEIPRRPDVVYTSQEDPDAIYTLADVEMTGSYVKLDFRDLDGDQINRLIHRLRTELSACGSGLTIDECLVNRPACVAAQHLAKQMIREKKDKG